MSTPRLPLLLLSCLLMLCACAGSNPRKAPESRPSLGTIRASDLELCEPIVPDAGNACADALKADSPSRTHAVECQSRQGTLRNVVRRLIRAGVLTLDKGK